MKILFATLLLFGCAHPAPLSPTPVGRSDRPYTALPEYLQNPLTHGMTPTEKLTRMNELLRDIDARAASLSADKVQEEQLQLDRSLTELHQVMPPKPDLIMSQARMQEVVKEMPRNSPDATRRRLWALTDTIRMRAGF